MAAEFEQKRQHQAQLKLLGCRVHKAFTTVTSTFRSIRSIVFNFNVVGVVRLEMQQKQAEWARRKAELAEQGVAEEAAGSLVGISIYIYLYIYIHIQTDR